MALTDEQKKRLEELRAARETTWVEQDKDRADAEELAVLEHEHAFRAVLADLEQKFGPRGVSWDAVDTAAGPIGVKIGDAISYTKFLEASAGADVVHLADAQDFIMPNLVHPTREKYISMCSAHHGIPFNVWPLLARLYRGERARYAGK